MAALTPTIVPALLTGASVGLNLLQRSQEVSAAEAAAKQNAKANQAEEAVKRRDALRRAQARARAVLASRGVGGASGSGAALLQGLAAETARDAAFAEQEFGLKAETIQLGLDASRQSDLLRLSEQRRRAQLDTLRQGLSLPNRFDLI